MLNWIKLEPGCKIPDTDEKVIWRHQNGEYGVFEIGKDKYWFNSIRHTLTHWARIPHPDEQESQHELWAEVGDIFHKGIQTKQPKETAITLLNTYIISRK